MEASPVRSVPNIRAPITIYQDTTIKAVSIVNGEKAQTFEAAYSVKIPEAVYTPPC